MSQTQCLGCNNCHPWTNLRVAIKAKFVLSYYYKHEIKELVRINKSFKIFGI